MRLYGGQGTADMEARREPAHEPVRVMRVISRLNVGGPSTHVVLLNAGLDQMGYRSLLVTLK